MDNERQIIAVVDDQSFICDMVTKILGADYEVHTFTRGEGLVRFMTDREVDLFILDYDMPHMTGYEVLLAVRTSKLNAKKPAIFLTGEMNERMKSEMLGRGANAYINKPINTNELREAVRKHINAAILAGVSDGA